MGERDKYSWHITHIYQECITGQYRLRLFSQAPPEKNVDSRNVLPKKSWLLQDKESRKGHPKCFPWVDKACYSFFARGNNHILWKDWQLQVIFKQRAVLCLTRALTCFRKAMGETRSTKLASPFTRQLMPTQLENSLDYLRFKIHKWHLLLSLFCLKFLTCLDTELKNINVYFLVFQPKALQ